MSLIQVNHLKDALHPKLQKAVIVNRATTLAEGIHIAIEIERAYWKAGKKLYDDFSPVHQPSYQLSMPVAQEQNYQQPKDFKKNYRGNYKGNDKTRKKETRNAFIARRSAIFKKTVGNARKKSRMCSSWQLKRTRIVRKM